MTSEQNLQCLCRHHHRAKHAIFTVRAEPDGTIVWITRGGWIFRRHPHRHRPPRHGPHRRPQGD
ncbi:MAG: hypothetical protein H7323_03500 [Frankiales bacterium]|nr:hypothetical protein [Frankiales bacterium]